LVLVDSKLSILVDIPVPNTETVQGAGVCEVTSVSYASIVLQSFSW